MKKFLAMLIALSLVIFTGCSGDTKKDTGKKGDTGKPRMDDNGKPKPEAEKPKPEAEKPKPEAEKPKPEAEKPKPEAEKPKPEKDKEKPK